MAGRAARLVGGIFAGLVAFSITYKIALSIVVIVGALILSIFGINIETSDSAYANLQGIANIPCFCVCSLFI